MSLSEPGNVHPIRPEPLSVRIVDPDISVEIGNDLDELQYSIEERITWLGNDSRIAQEIELLNQRLSENTLITNDVGYRLDQLNEKLDILIGVFSEFLES